MDDTDRRMFTILALFSGATGFGVLAGAAAQWATGSTALGVGVTLVAFALVFGTAAVGTEDDA